MSANVDILLVLIVILIIVLVWRGPKMLPQFGEALGKTVKSMRDSMSDGSGASDGVAADAAAAPDKDDADSKPGG